MHRAGRTTTTRRGLRTGSRSRMSTRATRSRASPPTGRARRRRCTPIRRTRSTRRHGRLTVRALPTQSSTTRYPDRLARQPLGGPRRAMERAASCPRGFVQSDDRRPPPAWTTSTDPTLWRRHHRRLGCVSARGAQRPCSLPAAGRPHGRTSRPLRRRDGRRHRHRRPRHRLRARHRFPARACASGERSAVPGHPPHRRRQPVLRRALRGPPRAAADRRGSGSLGGRRGRRPNLVARRARSTTEGDQVGRAAKARLWGAAGIHARPRAVPLSLASRPPNS